jgi:hypothetical protein
VARISRDADLDQPPFLWHLVCTYEKRDNEQKVIGAYEVNLVCEMGSQRFNIVSP